MQRSVKDCRTVSSVATEDTKGPCKSSSGLRVTIVPLGIVVTITMIFCKGVGIERWQGLEVSEAGCPDSRLRCENSFPCCYQVTDVLGEILFSWS